MKSLKWCVGLCAIVLLTSLNASASGPIGLYGIVERVVFEPNETAPERVQVWGAFAFVDGGAARPGTTLAPKRGYLYFKLPSGTQQAVKTEWADLKSLAGSGQAIGFGSWGYIGSLTGLDARTSTSGNTPPYVIAEGAVTDVRVRPASESPANPGVYTTNAGIVKLTDEGSHAAIVRQLKETLKTK